jgi:excisionase family DNA binding protein
MESLLTPLLGWPILSKRKKRNYHTKDIRVSKVKPPRNQSKLLTTGEVARYCDVSTNAVKKWIRNGRLKAFRTPGGHFRVDSEDFREFLVLHKMPVYAEFFEKKGRRILLVDDDSQVREMLAEVLRAMGRISWSWI